MTDEDQTTRGFVTVTGGFFGILLGGIAVGTAGVLRLGSLRRQIGRIQDFGATKELNAAQKEQLKRESYSIAFKGLLYSTVVSTASFGLATAWSAYYLDTYNVDDLRRVMQHEMHVFQNDLQGSVQASVSSLSERLQKAAPSIVSSIQESAFTTKVRDAMKGVRTKYDYEEDIQGDLERELEHANSVQDVQDALSKASARHEKRISEDTD